MSTLDVKHQQKKHHTSCGQNILNNIHLLCSAKENKSNKFGRRWSKLFPDSFQVFLLDSCIQFYQVADDVNLTVFLFYKVEHHWWSLLLMSHQIATSQMTSGHFVAANSCQCGYSLTFPSCFLPPLCWQKSHNARIFVCHSDTSHRTTTHNPEHLFSILQVNTSLTSLTKFLSVSNLSWRWSGLLSSQITSCPLWTTTTAWASCHSISSKIRPFSPLPLCSAAHLGQSHFTVWLRQLFLRLPASSSAV